VVNAVINDNAIMMLKLTYPLDKTEVDIAAIDYLNYQSISSLSPIK